MPCPSDPVPALYPLTLYTSSFASSTKRPLLGVQVGSPKDMLITWHLCSSTVMRARVRAVPVSVAPSRVSPILQLMICAPEGIVRQEG